MAINEHLALHVYKIFRLREGADIEEVKKRYKQLVLKFFPDKIRQIKKREPTPDEEKTWKDINEANRILNDNNLKAEWDNYGGITDPGRIAFVCLCEECINYLYYNERGEEIGRGKWIENRNMVYMSPISMRWFCSERGARQWEATNGYTPEVHGYAEDGGPNVPNSTSPTTTRTCPGCGLERPFEYEGIYWKRYSIIDPNLRDPCCSEYCLETYLNRKGIIPVTCGLQMCRKIKREGDSGENWFFDRYGMRLHFCSETHFLQELTRRHEMGLGFDSSSDPFQTKRTTAITEIEDALKQPPPVINTELEDANQSWRNKIQNADSDSTITDIKDQVLADITRKRQAKDSLAGLRKAAIDQILAALVVEEPFVDESEITNRNWEEDIKKAPSESVINSIREKTLADIRNKREKIRLEGLLSQSKEPQNWNNYQNLENIFQQIKDLRSSNAYQDHVTEIQTIEDRLKELEPNKFREMTEKSLNRQKRNYGLTDSDLDKETTEAMTEAIQDPTTENIKKAEDKIAVCGARKELTGILDQAGEVGENQQKKEELISQISEFMLRNDFTMTAYLEKKSVVDKLLSKLRGEDSENQQQNPEFPWLKVLVITALITLPIILIGFFILKIHQKTNRKLS